MPASLEYLERCAAETGYQVAALEKVTRLGEIAGEIGRHPALRSSLALKGGTAINLCSGPPTRMSVDLDFNFVGCTDREGMVQERPAIESALVGLVVKGTSRPKRLRRNRAASNLTPRTTSGRHRTAT